MYFIFITGWESEALYGSWNDDFERFGFASSRVLKVNKDLKLSI